MRAAADYAGQAVTRAALLLSPLLLLRPGELFERCRSAQLHVLAYEDGVVNGARVQRIAARRRAGALPLLESATL
jgi:hypothetical protein